MKKNYFPKTAGNKILISSFTGILLLILLNFSARATIYPFSNNYSGSQEVPQNTSPATGVIAGYYDDVTNTLTYSIIFSGLTSPTTAAHFHAPAPPGVNAPVIIAHVGFPVGVTAGTYSKTDVLTDVQEGQLLGGLVYSNIHTSALPGGEIRAQITLGAALPAGVFPFTNLFSGSQEVPPNNSPARGIISGTYNDASNTLSYTITFSDLLTPTTAAHLHAPAPPGANAPVVIPHAGFPTGVTAGTYSKTDVLSPQQESWLFAGLMYSNIHTTGLPGGEIRAQIFLGPPFTPPTISCQNITVSNAPNQCSQTVSLSATTGGSPAPLVSFRIGTTPITSTHTFPVGTTTVTATALSGGGIANCTFTVTVNDTQAPTITGLSATPNRLWPANHKMVPVTINYSSTDNCTGTVICGLSVTSNEPANGKGDGKMEADWTVVDNNNILLRAERSGKGNGRIYTITVTCRDQAGNQSQSSTTVTVAHDNSKGFAEITGREEVELFIGELSVRPLINPSSNYFTLIVQSPNTTDKIDVRLFDIAGQIVESKMNTSAGQVVKVGHNLTSGVYIVELRQGSERKQLKLVKTN